MQETTKKPYNPFGIFLGGNIVLAIFVVSSVTFQVIHSRQEVIDQAKMQASNTSMIIEKTILTSIKSIDIVTGQIKYELQKKGVKLSEADRSHFLASIGEMKGILLTWVDENGRPIGKEFEGALPKDRINYADRDYFKALKAGVVDAELMAGPMVGKSTGKWVTIKAKRFNDSMGKFKGAAVVAITQDFFEEIKDKINVLGDDSFTVAVGREPKYFYRYPSKPEIIGKPLIPVAGTEDVISGKTHRAVFETKSPVTGRSRIAAQAWVGSEPILIVIGVDQERILKHWRKESIVTLSTTFIGLCLFIFLSFYFLKNSRAIRNYRAQLASATKLAALGEMAGGMAHEINTPLAIIELSATSLIQTLEGHYNKASVTRSLNTIIQTTERIAKIIKGLKAFSRNGENDPFEIISTSELLDQALILCEEKLKASSVHLTINNPHPLLNCHCRSVQLSQVLINLLNNSVDAIENNKEKWIKIEVNDLVERVEISITDSGSGIPKSVQEKIFNPFFTTKEIGKGTGLGLSISKGIMQSHGGDLQIDTSSKNTRFILFLPKSLKKTINQKEAA